MNNIKLSDTCQIQNLVSIYQKYFPNKTDGVFVEVGAFDGESYSNTSGLADIGWSGIYVEPVPAYANLCANRHAQNNVKVVNAAIHPENEGQFIEIFVGDAFTTLLADHVSLYKQLPYAAHNDFNQSMCQTMRLDSVLHNNAILPGFDLLVIDVEGMEEKVFESFRLSEWNPRMLIVELVDKNGDFQGSPEMIQSSIRVRNKILASDYESIYEDHINTIFINKNPITHKVVDGSLNLGDLPDLLGRKDPVILDIGTNNGGHTRAFFDLFPYGIIHSFEPDPRCIAKFKANLASYPRAILHEIAIGSANGTAEFYASGGQNIAAGYEMEGGWDMSGSLRKPTGHLEEHPGITFDNKFPVTIQTLDDWYSKNLTRNIDFIWADVQGAELDLIKGGLNTFQNHTRYFYTEYSNKELYEGQINLDAILNLLTNFEVILEFKNNFDCDVLLKNKTII
jgi:2-O-methyltransferase